MVSVRRKLDENGELNDNEELYFSVGGLNSDTDHYVDWVRQDLKPGDKISIQVINDKFDEPVSIKETEPKEVIIQRKIEYYHQLKEELKEYLNE